MAGLPRLHTSVWRLGGLGVPRPSPPLAAPRRRGHPPHPRLTQERLYNGPHHHPRPALATTAGAARSTRRRPCRPSSTRPCAASRPRTPTTRSPPRPTRSTMWPAHRHLAPAFPPPMGASRPCRPRVSGLCTAGAGLVVRLGWCAAGDAGFRPVHPGGGEDKRDRVGEWLQDGLPRTLPSGAREELGWTGGGEGCGCGCECGGEWLGLASMRLPRRFCHVRLRLLALPPACAPAGAGAARSQPPPHTDWAEELTSLKGDHKGPGKVRCAKGMMRWEGGG